MDVTGFKTLYWRQFNSIREGAEYFHVSKVTIRRWLNGETIINPMAEKLLIIKSLGYLPNDMRWKGFRIDEYRAVLITPEGREFSPKELDAFAIWRDEYRELVRLHGHVERPPHIPAKENVLPFRGGRRMQAAPWIPTKFR
ncbi:DUF3653 domain-containing protein [Vibrio coralliilyticus]|uniref:DUF3653 domain-containing protein n=1 Tax=Vibrio coralliilyticus TaxID=190893 RepID=UPI00052AAA88|nr:DUF3653 domain-containing protein [Vibrio coralliilyticus]AIU66858.1 S-adenosylhomocysteine hydrolase [Vibrio coralliilyticus]